MADSTAVTNSAQANTCYFRTGPASDSRKALVQVTERCDLRCAHCFVSATKEGLDLSLEDFSNRVIPALLDLRVAKLTLTGGEPFVHPDVMQMIRVAVDAGMDVGICSNATSITRDQMYEMKDMQNVHVNVSFDGFSAQTHGKFRGSRASFANTKRNTELLGDFGLLQGILSTPNQLTTPAEFAELADFGMSNGSEYLLMNPLSAFGRGVKSHARLSADEDEMRETRQAVINAVLAENSSMEVLPIRFPNDEGKLLGDCRAESFLYVFATGELTMCPYLAFAARDHLSASEAMKFSIGNILHGELDTDRLTSTYVRRAVGTNGGCQSCGESGGCGRGCPAAVLASGGALGGLDSEQCPLPATGPGPVRPLLPLEVKK